MVLASLTKCIPRSLWNCALWSLLSPVACCLGTAAHASTKGMPSCFNYPEWHWNIGDSSIKTSIYREIPILYHGLYGFALTFPYSFAAKMHVEQESQLKHTGWLHAGAHRRKSSFIIASVLHHCFFQMSHDKIYYPCEPVKNMVRILWFGCFTMLYLSYRRHWQHLAATPNWHIHGIDGRIAKPFVESGRSTPGEQAMNPWDKETSRCEEQKQKL